MRETKPDNKYIHLVDSYRSKSWKVSIWALRDHPTDSQVYFSFKQHGGKLKAFKAAKVWRNKRLNSLGLSGELNIKSNNKNPRLHNLHNSSGVTGVGLCYSWSNPEKEPRHPCWSARYQIDGKQRSKAYSIMKYGEDKAFMMACLMRSFKTGELSVVDVKAMPVTLRRLKYFLKDTVATGDIHVRKSA